jgi:hypothetical protein
MAKQAQAAEHPQAAERSQPPERAPVAEAVRVRVRDGRTIQLGGGRVARGGTWVEVDPVELRTPSFRSAVETVQEHAESTKTDTERREEAANAGGSSLFDSMRNVARQQHAALRDRDAAARRMAAELLDPNRPLPEEKPMARELPQQR